MLMRKEKLCNLETLALWAANRQMRLEGGFQARIKLAQCKHQGWYWRHYLLFYINVFKKDIIYIIFQFLDIYNLFLQNQTLICIVFIISCCLDLPWCSYAFVRFPYSKGWDAGTETPKIQALLEWERVWPRGERYPRFLIEWIYCWIGSFQFQHFESNFKLIFSRNCLNWKIAFNITTGRSVNL